VDKDDHSAAAHVAYEPIVRIQCYGKDTYFGEYHRDSYELKILNQAMVGDVDLIALKKELDKTNRENGTLGSHMLINVPIDVYKMREKFRDTDHHDR
jgi:hypothetical protein